MRIVLDVSGSVGGPSGIRRYAEQLLKALPSVGPEHEYLVYAAFWRDWPRPLLEQFRIPEAPNVRPWPVRLPQQLLLPAEEVLGLRVQERLLRARGVDLVHGVANVMPRLRDIPSVATLHHVGGLPEGARAWDGFYHRRLTRGAVTRADRVIAVSETTRRAAIEEYGLDPARVATVWEGCDAEVFGGPDDPGPRERLGLGGPYLLFVSAINARKNLVRLVQAYALLRGRRSLEHRLVLVGRRDRSFPDVQAQARASGVEDRTVFLEGLGDAELRSVYRGCSLFVYPSLLEGFGLPMLEAMASGAPVLAARASCLPEVAGDAALFCDGTDVEDMARQMERALFDEDLRAGLVARGRERLRLFDWKETARRTLAVYAEAVRAARSR